MWKLGLPLSPSRCWPGCRRAAAGSAGRQVCSVRTWPARVPDRTREMALTCFLLQQQAIPSSPPLLISTATLQFSTPSPRPPGPKHPSLSLDTTLLPAPPAHQGHGLQVCTQTPPPGSPPAPQPPPGQASPLPVSMTNHTQGWPRRRLFFARLPCWRVALPRRSC